VGVVRVCAAFVYFENDHASQLATSESLRIFGIVIHVSAAARSLLLALLAARWLHLPTLWSCASAQGQACRTEPAQDKNILSVSRMSRELAPVAMQHLLQQALASESYRVRRTLTEAVPACVAACHCCRARCDRRR
jgi:hypothetical protein